MYRLDLERHSGNRLGIDGIDEFSDGPKNVAAQCVDLIESRQLNNFRHGRQELPKLAGSPIELNFNFNVFETASL